jgi:hypothetical protein
MPDVLDRHSVVDAAADAGAVAGLVQFLHGQLEIGLFQLASFQPSFGGLVSHYSSTGDSVDLCDGIRCRSGMRERSCYGQAWGASI